MQSRHALETVRAVGWAAGPAAVATIGLGAMVAPAVAQGPHHQHQHHQHQHQHQHQHGTVTIRGVVTATSDGSTLQIVRNRDAHRNCLAPKITTLTLGPATSYTTPSTPGAAGLAVGDAVTVTIAVPPSTNPTTVAATAVVDSGPATPITCSVRGTATDPASGGAVTIAIAIATGHSRHVRHQRHAATGGRRHNANLHRLFAALPTPPKTLTVGFGPGTTFIDIPNPSDTITQIAAGDRLTVIWSQIPGAIPHTVVATKIIDQGPPPPIRYVARGTDATAPDTTAMSFGLTIGHIRPNVAPTLDAGTVLPVLYNTSTVFDDIAHPTDSISQIAPGDRLIVTWSAPHGTQATNLPAAVRVVDRGPAGMPG